MVSLEFDSVLLMTFLLILPMESQEFSYYGSVVGKELPMAS